MSVFFRLCRNAAGQRAFTLAPHWDVIDSCFGQETVEDIVAALERKAAQGFDLAHSALEQLKKRSPLVLKVGSLLFDDLRTTLPLALCS